MTPAAAQAIFADDPEPAWSPDPATIERSRLTRLIRRLGLTGIDDLHRRAVADPDWYWRTVVDDLGIDFARPFDAVVDTSAGREFPRWFPGGTFNVSANCLDRHATGPGGGKPAVVWEDEAGTTRSVSYTTLLDDVVSLARYLRSIGVETGDRVALYLPMIPEAAVAFLACARIGAVVVPAFSGYGPDALAARLNDSGATVLVTADGLRRKGAVIDLKAAADRAAGQAPSVTTVLVVRRGAETRRAADGRHVDWQEALAIGQESGADGGSAALDPNHPLLIAYTSGTTGRPKGIVLSQAGFAVKVGHDLGYCLDVQADDVIFWITDMGWLVGPLLIVGSLMFGATAVFYEGVPDHPDPGRIWSLIQRHRVTLQGISPTAVRALMAAGDEWLAGAKLDTLRAFATTGEPWNPEPWSWLFEQVGGGRVPILNYSGGTEVGGGILSCYPILPLRPCAFSGPVIGMDVDVLDDAGQAVRGPIGELVVRSIWPGMTHSFWEDRQRYLDTYWSRRPGVWWHGDLARVDAEGYWYISGRADDTIKVAGKRVGPAEVESAVVAHPAVAEAAAVGVPDETKGQVVVCFVVTTGGEPGATLEREIKAAVGDRLGKTLIPHDIVFVTGLPKTKNNKIVRRVIRARYLGLPQGDLSSLEDVASLRLIPERLIAEAAHR